MWIRQVLKVLQECSRCCRCSRCNMETGATGAQGAANTGAQLVLKVLKVHQGQSGTNALQGAQGAHRHICSLQWKPLVLKVWCSVLRGEGADSLLCWTVQVPKVLQGSRCYRINWCSRSSRSSRCYWWWRHLQDALVDTS